MTYGEQIEQLKAAGVLVWAGTLATDGRLQDGPWIMQPGGVDLYRITEDVELLAQRAEPADLSTLAGQLRHDAGLDPEVRIAVHDLQYLADVADELDRLRAAEAPQPRVLWRCESVDIEAAFCIPLDVPSGTRVVVIEDSAAAPVHPESEPQ